MASETAPAQRIVPGVPEPQKKKRAKKGSCATGGKANESDVAAPTSAPESVGGSVLPVEDSEEGGIKSSPVVEILNKRIKALSKKIIRFQSYAGKPVLELNEDQKTAVATLPSLEAVLKELEDTRKAVQNLEMEQAKTTARLRQEAERQEKQRIQDVLAAEQNAHISRTLRAFDLVRLHSALASGDGSTVGLNLEGEEYNAVFASAKQLLSPDSELRQLALTAFLTEEGEVEGISVTRLFEILDQYLHPRIPEEPPVEHVEVQIEVEADTPPAEEVLPEAVAGILSAASAPSGQMNFSFVQESELDVAPAQLEATAEFGTSVESVEKDEALETPATEPVITARDISEMYAPAEATEARETAGNGAINWADDEGDLPSIAGLQASFAASGPATPTAEGPEQKAELSALGSDAPDVEGAQAAADDDGFMQARGGRGARRGGRGSGRGGEPRGDRAFRGGNRRDFRGGERGQGYRGRGRDPGYGGSAEGGRGWRGRGRGRGDYRGGTRGGRGGGAAPPPENAE